MESVNIPQVSQGHGYSRCLCVDGLRRVGSASIIQHVSGVFCSSCDAPGGDAGCGVGGERLRQRCFRSVLSNHYRPSIFLSTSIRRLSYSSFDRFMT